MVHIAKTKEQTKKRIPYISQRTVFPDSFLWNSMIVWVWLGNIFQLQNPQPWPRRSKSVRLFLSVAFPRIHCLSACQHLSCLLTDSGCCSCLPRVSWNRRKKDLFPSKGHFIWEKKNKKTFNVSVCILDCGNDSLQSALCLFVDYKDTEAFGTDSWTKVTISTLGVYKNHPQPLTYNSERTFLHIQQLIKNYCLSPHNFASCHYNQNGMIKRSLMLYLHCTSMPWNTSVQNRFFIAGLR